MIKVLNVDFQDGLTDAFLNMRNEEAHPVRESIDQFALLCHKCP